VLERVIAERGAPQTLRCDNGPEVTSRHFYGSSEERGIRLVHIEPGSAVQNGYVESLQGRFRDECLNANWFLHIGDAKQKIEQWRMEYNEERPHSSLAYSTQKQYAEACSDSTSSMAGRGNMRGAAEFPLVDKKGKSGKFDQSASTPRSRRGQYRPAARRYVRGGGGPGIAGGIAGTLNPTRVRL
jgi:putative transposase